MSLSMTNPSSRIHLLLVWKPPLARYRSVTLEVGAYVQNRILHPADARRVSLRGSSGERANGAALTGTPPDARVRPEE